MVMAGVSSFRKLSTRFNLVVANIWSNPRGFESHPSQCSFFSSFFYFSVEEIVGPFILGTAKGPVTLDDNHHAREVLAPDPTNRHHLNTRYH